MNKAFLKWAGGKQWLVNNESHRFPDNYDKYFEPFLGGGSVFFFLSPTQSVLSDVNRELIDTYIAVRDEAEVVFKQLKMHQYLHSEEYYYMIRKRHPRKASTCASRMIYLNRTCYNGIYRVNKKGEFNVPIGTPRKLKFDKDKLLAASSALKNAELLCQDFQKTIELAQKGDFIFCDPPYAVIDEDNRFIGYNAEHFTWDDQKRLADALVEAKNRGVLILMTNVDHPRIRAIYENENGFNLDTVERSCVISGTQNGRKKYQELIVTANY